MWFIEQLEFVLKRQSASHNILNIALGCWVTKNCVKLRSALQPGKIGIFEICKAHQRESGRSYKLMV